MPLKKDKKNFSLLNITQSIKNLKMSFMKWTKDFLKDQCALIMTFSSSLSYFNSFVSSCNAFKVTRKVMESVFFF